MKIQIKNRLSGVVIYEGEHDSIKEAVVSAVSSGANLSGAYLSGANLSGADLRGADLRDAYLRGADLSDAYLSGADLRGADLRGADLSDAYLRGADLRGAVISWRSHYLIAEILFRAAGEDIDKRKIAGLILISTDWCWDEFIKIDDPLKEWAMRELVPWVKDGDNAPDVLRKMAIRQRESEAGR